MGKGGGKARVRGGDLDLNNVSVWRVTEGGAGGSAGRRVEIARVARVRPRWIAARRRPRSSRRVRGGRSRAASAGRAIRPGPIGASPSRVPPLHQRQSSPSSRVWLDRGEAGRDRGTHQEENLGVLLPQPEAGEDIVEEIEEPHGRRRRSVRAEISSPRSESPKQTSVLLEYQSEITSPVTMLS